MPGPNTKFLMTVPQPAEAHPLQNVAHATLGQLHAPLRCDHPRQVHSSPAQHAVLDRIGSVPHPIGDFRFLLRRQQRLGSDVADLVGQASKARFVIAMHPVAQRLTVHAARLGGVRARRAIKDHSEREHSPCGSHILATACLSPKPGRVKAQPCNPERRPHANLRQSNPQKKSHRAHGGNLESQMTAL